MTTSARTRLTPELRRASLVDTATALFAGRPAHEVSVDDIVGAAGVSRALFYRYFSGPDEIFQAAAQVVADGLVTRWRELPSDRPPLETLTAAVEEFLDVAEQNAPAYIALVGNRSALDSGRDGDVVGAVRAAIVDEIHRRLGLSGRGPSRLGPLAEHTLELWLTAVESSVLAWLRERMLPRQDLVAWLVAQVVAMTTTTARYDDTAAEIVTRVLGAGA